MHDSPEPRDADQASDIIPGRRAVLEALHAQRPLRKILLSRTAHGTTVRDIVTAARQRDIVVQVVDAYRLDRVAHAAHHQGVIALASAKPLVSVADIVAVARARNEAPLVVVLDGIEDPANLGAIIRTAEGTGVHGVIIPKHRAAGLTPAVARASAGALEHVLVAQVTNITRVLTELQAMGLWIVGADAAAEQVYTAVALRPPLALVMGGEGRGLSRLVREHCDILVRVPMRGRMASLNVAVASAVLLYEVVRQATPTNSAVSARAPFS
jgi:23S rRNA (guanosine2251-2'-O)-methyltransferase